MPKLIIGLVGHIGSGKGAVLDHIKSTTGASTYMYSQFLRDVLERIHVDATRQHLTDLSIHLREAFGQDLFARVVAADLASATSDIIVLDGVRRKTDLDHIKDLPGFVLVHVNADTDTRLTRINARGQNADDAGKTKDAFAKDKELETERSIDEVIPMATETIDNNGTLEETQAQVDALMSKIMS